ncbi:MAG TPA: pyrimidine dimer DNA glycosylase/endonuclease V [Gemmatimonadales bacterium]|nr:pyrimidine dimer DNA glycosylase/endonuclease V [Gemmatimonadales bacterium]
MRLWSLHPRHLDAQGLVALWREGLLARAVLRNRTAGYRHHPQLDRFRAHPSPVAAINTYLAGVYAEARRRGYRFDEKKCRGPRTARRIPVSRGQLDFEWTHLLRKLRLRAPAQARVARTRQPTPHPLFRATLGPVADWERGPSRRMVKA